MAQFQDNIDLFCQTRHNISTILNEYVILIHYTVNVMQVYHLDWIWSLLSCEFNNNFCAA